MTSKKYSNVRFGWKPDLPDHRDKLAKIPLFARGLPDSVDLRSQCPPIYDQRELGSCTAQAVCALFQFTEQEQRRAPTDLPSRLFLYYNSRAIESLTNEDSGSSIRTTIKALAKYGVCRDIDWPYITDNFRVKPADKLYKQASIKRVSSYQRVAQRIYDIKAQLAKGNPVAFGFTVYDSFMSKETHDSGICPMPEKNEDALGGHAVLIVGYDTKRGQFLIRNSWGPFWGIGGYFWMPTGYVLNSKLAGDFWTITATP